MSDNKYRPTVMPKDESLEQQNNFLGGPGIQLPKDADNIAAFRETSDVNAKDLNARIHAEQAAKKEGYHPTDVPGIQLAADAKEFKEFNNEDAQELNARLHK